MAPASINAQVGDVVPERTVGPVTRMDIARYSISTDDPNRAHIEESVATAAGLPTVTGSAGIVSGLVEDVITSWAGMGSIRRAATRMRYPLFPGAILTAKAAVRSRTEEAGSLVLELQADVHDDSGTMIFDGTYTVVVAAV